MLTSDKVPSDISSKNEIKPAMAVGHDSRSALQSPSVPAGSLPGATPRGPRVDHRKLASKVDIRLTAPLREALTAAAKAEGITDGAWIRALVADRLGIEAEADRVSAPRQRIPDEDLAVLAGLVRDIGGLYAPARTGKVEEVLAGLDAVRAALVPMVVGLNAPASRVMDEWDVIHASVLSLRAKVGDARKALVDVKAWQADMRHRLEIIVGDAGRPAQARLDRAIQAKITVRYPAAEQ